MNNTHNYGEIHRLNPYGTKQFEDNWKFWAYLSNVGGTECLHSDIYALIALVVP